MKIDKKLKITMTRSQLCVLMRACTLLHIENGKSDDIWKQLHDELLEILNEWDRIVLRSLDNES